MKKVGLLLVVILQGSTMNISATGEQSLRARLATLSLGLSCNNESSKEEVIQEFGRLTNTSEERYILLAQYLRTSQATR